MTSKLRYSLIVLVVALGGCNRQDLGLALGTQAPRLATKTLADVGGDLSRMTTYRQPDPRMYQ
jgi:hypothetical protein